jgi:hypothetical protein
MRRTRTVGRRRWIISVAQPIEIASPGSTGAREQVPAQARPVGAAQVLDLQHRSDVQPGVVARGVRVVDAHVVVLAPPDRHLTLLWQRVHREDVRPHDDQVQDPVVDGPRVRLTHRVCAGGGGDGRRFVARGHCSPAARL